MLPKPALIDSSNSLSASPLVSGQLATRLRAVDFNFMSQVLPNPDPILKAIGKDITAYRDLSRHPHVGACIRRRKSAVKSMQWGVDRAQAPARVAKAITDMVSGLDMECLIGNALDATLYGYQPMEVDWRAGAGGPFQGTWAADVVSLPPEWFCFDGDNALRFKTRSAPTFGELLPERKFLVPRQDATYANPYGLGDLALCWWAVVFMKGGMRFWLSFAEKYGGAFLYGKLPRGTPDAERNALLKDLEEMIQNGVGVIPDDGSVMTVESAGKSASAELYEQLVAHSRAEISIALLGTNQTVEKDAGKASAYAGMDVAEDLRDGDAEIVTSTVNQLIRWTVELNWPGAAAPVFGMWDQQAKDQLQAARDKSNHEAGAVFTKSYWVRSYGYQEDDLVETASTPSALIPGAAAAAGNASAVAFAQGVIAATTGAHASDPPDPTAAVQDELATAAAPAWGTLVDQVQALVDAAPDLATLQRTLVAAYGGLDTAELVKLMAAAFALAELKGIDAARAAAGLA